LPLAISIVLAGIAFTVAASAQNITFYGPFTSYQQTEVEYAQALVANAAGDLYVSGTSNLGYVPVNANGTPIISGEMRISGDGSNIMGMAIDSANNIYRADAGSAQVQKYTYVGSNTTFTNSNTPTYIGTGWTTPSSVVVDSSFNVYVLDAGPGSIVELTPSGSSYTQATLYTNTLLKNTTGMSMDSSGNFYIASGTNYGQSPFSSTTAAVYKLTKSGSSYTLSTLGTGWNSPAGTAVDFAGNVWVSDYGAGTINLLSPYAGSYQQSVFTTISQLRTLTVNKTGQLYGFAYASGDALIWAGGSAPHNLGSYSVGTAAPTVAVTVSFLASTTFSSFSVLTEGAAGRILPTQAATHVHLAPIQPAAPASSMSHLLPRQLVFAPARSSSRAPPAPYWAQTTFTVLDWDRWLPSRPGLLPRLQVTA
jgi:hypothetical protein